MMNKKYLLIGIFFLSILGKLYATAMPGDLSVYVGIGSDGATFYLCPNAKNPQYASETEKFSPENVCFYYTTSNQQAGVTYQTSVFGEQTFRLLNIGGTVPAIALFEYLSGSNYLKVGAAESPFSTGFTIGGYYEPHFIETSPTGYIKLLFNKRGTYTIRYLAVGKAVGPQPFIFYGPVLSKEEVLNEPPVVYLYSPAPGTQLINRDTVNLVFKAVDPENRTMTCYYYVGGVENAVSVLSGENVSIALKIDYLGNITIRVICKDPFGLTGSASTYVIRESPPASSIINPTENALITNNSLSVDFMVADNGPYLLCNLSIENTTITKTMNITLPDNGVTFKHTTLYLTNLTDGKKYTLKLVCEDSVGLRTQSQVTFEYALDPDHSARYCSLVNGEWYGDHCCGDDQGERKSVEAKGYPTPEAFDPSTCSIIQLNPGQCDDNSDCPPSGWFCSSDTVRELRRYTCVKNAGELIGHCQAETIQSEDCTQVNESYICTSGVCAPQEQPNQPPTIQIIRPRPPKELFTLPAFKDTINVTFKVTDDNSETVICNLTINDNIINLGSLNVSQTYTFNVSGIVNGTNTITITCMDAYNETASASTIAEVNKLPVECVTDADCGVDAWRCVSPTERAYIDYKCDAGKCVANITATESAPSGYICMDGQFVSENSLTCATDADCPPDDRVCTSDGTGYVIRDWYCDTNAGVCKYRINQTVQCGANQYCLAGACWDKGETACEGMILTFCTSNTTYQELVAVYKEDLGTCVYVPAGTFNCPSGTVCFAGKCSTEPTGNLPPVIDLNITTPKIRVGEAAKIVVRVTDDNTPALFVNISVQAPEVIQVFKGVAIAGKPFVVFYRPPHASTHVVTVTATDQYGVSTTKQSTIEVEEAAPAGGGAGGAGGAPAGGAGGGGGGAGIALPTAAATAGALAGTSSIVVAIIVLAAVGLAVYWFYLRK